MRRTKVLLKRRLFGVPALLLVLLVVTSGTAAAVVVKHFRFQEVTKEPLSFKVIDDFEVSYPGEVDEIVVKVTNSAPDTVYGVLADLDVTKDEQIASVTYSSTGGVYLSATEDDHAIGDPDPWDAEFNADRASTGEIRILVETALDAKPGPIALRLNLDRVEPYPMSIVLLATNDFEGFARPSYPKSDLGGSPYMASYFRATEEAVPSGVLILDAGDTIGAAPLFSGAFEGASVIDLYNEMGYDIMAIGNHEYDWGLDVWLERMAEAEFPCLSANTYWADNGSRAFQPTAMFSLRGIKVGVIGLITPETPDITVPAFTEDLLFTDGAEEIDYFSRELQASGADVIVVLAHYGDVETTNELLDSVTERVDVFLNGHGGPARVREYKGVLCEKTEGKGRDFARIDLRVDPRTHTVLSKSGVLENVEHEVLYEGKLMVPDPVIEAKVEGYEAIIEEMASEVIGFATEDITREWGLSELGDLVTDAAVQYFNEELGVLVDFAVQNPGGIRADIEAGDVTYGEVYATLPFPNYYVVCTMTGAEVEQLLEDGMDIGFIQENGLDFTVNWDNAYGNRVSDVRIHETGEPIDPSATYKVVANNFIAAGGDKYTTLTEVPQEPYFGVAYRDPLVWYFREFSPVTPEIEETITIIGEP